MKRLNYHHLYYFWRVARSGKLTEVANELHISQSALSAQIKQLEARCGGELFIRRGRGLVISERGKWVLEHAQEIFAKAEALEKRLNEDEETPRQHIVLGVQVNLSRNFVEEFITPFLADANLSLSMRTLPFDDLAKSLINQELDMILTSRPVSDATNVNTWQHQLVSRQPIAIVGPAKKRIPTPFPQGYAEAHWVLPTRAHEIRAAFEFFCAKAGYKPHVKAEADDMAMLRLLARDTQALAVLPPVVVKDEIKQGLLDVYTHVPQAYENFYAITANQRMLPRAVINLLEEAMKRLA